MPRAPKAKEDDEIDDEFANPPEIDTDDRPEPTPAPNEDGTAGSDPRTPPRMIPRTLARTPTSTNAMPLSAEELRKQRLRKRVKPPRADKDQLNGRVPIFLIDAVRDWCDKVGITEIGEGMTILVETGLNAHDPDVAPDAYADRAVETGFFADKETAKQRYASGESQ